MAFDLWPNALSGCHRVWRAWTPNERSAMRPPHFGAAKCRQDCGAPASWLLPRLHAIERRIRALIVQERMTGVSWPRRHGELPHSGALPLPPRTAQSSDRALPHQSPAALRWCRGYERGRDGPTAIPLNGRDRGRGHVPRSPDQLHRGLGQRCASSRVLSTSR